MAEWTGKKYDYDYQQENRWTEAEAKPPSAPQEDGLLPFQVSAATDNRFFVDAASLQVGVDGVVRYVLVVKMPGGATNVSFEGIRCVTREVKVYALGRADGSWADARMAAWRPIPKPRANRQHNVLFDDFFCPRGSPVRDVEEAILALKQGMHPRARD